MISNCSHYFESYKRQWPTSRVECKFKILRATEYEVYMFDIFELLFIVCVRVYIVFWNCDIKYYKLIHTYIYLFLDLKSLLFQ